MKLTRFRKPDFQEKLARARGFQRKPSLPEKRGVVGKYLIAFVVLVILYFLAVSQMFLVKKVVLASDRPNVEQIEDVLRRMSHVRFFKIVPSNHILFMQKKDLLKVVQQDLPELRDITQFRKKYPDEIEIAVEIRQPQYVLQSGADFFLLDQDAVAFQKILNYSPEAYAETLVIDRTAAGVKIGEQLQPGVIFEFISKVKKLWQAQIPQTNLMSFSVPGVASQDVNAKTAFGFEVYFDIGRSAEKQLQNLNLVLSREIKPETYSGLSYVDLRLATTAYYCYKDASCSPGGQILNPKH